MKHKYTQNEVKTMRWQERCALHGFSTAEYLDSGTSSPPPEKLNYGEIYIINN